MSNGVTPQDIRVIEAVAVRKALERLRGGAEDSEAASEPILWPEHFDLAIELGDEAADAEIRVLVGMRLHRHAVGLGLGIHPAHLLVREAHLVAEAVDLIDEVNEIGITHVVFKPGTVEQIRSVIRIATEVPTKPVIMHVEGGRAGGHHSWEDLDDLLLATYSELRSRPNITVCVGGGIGTPERAAEYLSGRWAQSYGFPLMPVDGILVGTAAMATLVVLTALAVKVLHLVLDKLVFGKLQVWRKR